MPNNLEGADMSFDIGGLVSRWSLLTTNLPPWHATAKAQEVVAAIVESSSGDEWIRSGESAVHKTAFVSASAVLDGPVLIGPGCRVSHWVHLRGGVWLDVGVTVGTGGEIKSSFLFAGSAAAHLNYIGDSIVGADVNIEAGAVLANHWNEKRGQEVGLLWDGRAIATGVTKFGSIIGDESRIGANAVLSPGSILPQRSTVRRLELIDQSAASD